MAFPFAIESIAFPGLFLQLALNSSTSGSQDPVTVNLTSAQGPNTRFVLRARGDDVYGIQSVEHPDYFLSLDATEVTDFPGPGSIPGGAGKVSATKDTDAAIAKFKLGPNDKRGGNFFRAADADAFLRLNGSGVKVVGGIVNAQNYAGDYEALNLVYFPQTA